jgi:hypothetical protein
MTEGVWAAPSGTTVYGIMGEQPLVGRQDIEIGGQDDPLPLPEGWELSPCDPDIAKNVVAPYQWGTRVLIMANGDESREGARPGF